MSHLVLTGHSDVVMGVIITNRDDIYEKFKFLQNGELIQINPFVPNIHFLYPLKTSENLTVSCCFQGVDKGCIRNKWVNLKKIYLLQRLWSMLLLLLLLYYDLLSSLNSTPNRKKSKNECYSNYILQKLKQTHGVSVYKYQYREGIWKCIILILS